MNNTITIPEYSLVVLIGISGSGKSSFAKKHFLPTEVLSSDFCRALVSDDENSQAATKDAFEVLRYIAAKRLSGFKLTVIDATNVQSEARKSLLKLAKEHHALPVAIVLNLDERTCNDRNAERDDRNFGEHVIKQQGNQLRQSLKRLKKEGFRYIYNLDSIEAIDSVKIERAKLWTNLKHETGPFDIIGDVHGCFDELLELLESLGYKIDKSDKYLVTPPVNRKAIFVGDLVDRGPNSTEVLRLVMDMVESGSALCVPGNHEVKLMRKLRGQNVKIAYGLGETLQQLENYPAEFIQRVIKFIDGLISHYILDDGNLVVAHAGMKEAYQGRASGKIRSFALYGDTTGETDEFGLPIRYPWANEYRGKATVVYGHTPIPESEWINNTINIDNGCVFGGKLTALRYPEKELVSVKAKQVYADPIKPLLHPERSESHRIDSEMLDITDVQGKRIVETRLHHNVTIREENAIAALEVMSRFAIDPRWLIYLPPTMSPCETSKLDDYLEYPHEGLSYYRKQGISKVICQEKHMGSRAIVVICKDKDVVKNRFKINSSHSIGVCYTRTGRNFFNDQTLENEFLSQLASAISKANMWEKLKTDWLCLDCELLPWSLKSKKLLIEQYAPLGTAANNVISHTLERLKQAQTNNLDTIDLLECYQKKQAMITEYISAYENYCWPVNSINDIKLAPFHILASEGATYFEKPHEWHMQQISDICSANANLLKQTKYLIADTCDELSCSSITNWWHEFTESGGEGMVIKPLEFTTIGNKGLIQPGVKCRGRNYLRIIYGPEYTVPETLNNLKNRNLSRKRSLALREYALGVEALERFINGDSLYKYHECVFGLLALESEPVDPRL